MDSIKLNSLIVKYILKLEELLKLYSEADTEFKKGNPFYIAINARIKEVTQVIDELNNLKK